MKSTPITASKPDARAFLDGILASTRVRVERLKQDNLSSVLSRGVESRQHRLLRAALESQPPSIIAEIKKASPSKGVFKDDFDPISLAKAYHSGGAAALSIVTEPAYFGGDPVWIGQIRADVHLPILRKDFILDPVQVTESNALGADAILLIARILSVTQMRELQDAATQSGLEVVFEAHDGGDLEKISQCSPTIVGVNARNLDTFQVDREQFRALAGSIPTGCVRVAESGIASAAEIQQCLSLGYSGFLIGETLIRSTDPESLIRELRQA